MNSWSLWKKAWIPLSAIVMVLLSHQYLAGADTRSGPHGGDVVTDGTYQFEVKIDRRGQSVDVYALGKKQNLPKTLDLTLFRNLETGETIRLKAVDLHEQSPHYQGNVSPYQGSYVGLELRFEASFKSFKVLRNVPPPPPRSGP